MEFKIFVEWYSWENLIVNKMIVIVTQLSSKGQRDWDWSLPPMASVNFSLPICKFVFSIAAQAARDRKKETTSRLEETLKM